MILYISIQFSLFLEANPIDAKSNSGAIKALKDRSIIVNLIIGDQ
jgi:hypothetical protein